MSTGGGMVIKDSLFRSDAGLTHHQSVRQGTLQLKARFLHTWAHGCVFCGQFA